MAAPTVKLKRSSVAGKVPTTTDLDLGEIAINTYDGKAYFKKDDGTESIVEIGTGAGGGGASGTYTAPKLLSLYEKTNSGSPDAFDGAETRFQLRDDSGNIVSGVQALFVLASVNGVQQKPNTGTPAGSFDGFYITANATLGYDIVFGSAPATGAEFFGILSGIYSAANGTSAIKILDDISSSFNTSDTAFTLQYDGSTYTPNYPDAIIVSLGGVVQVPTDAYSISGSTITFTAAPPTGTTFYAVSLEIGEAASFSVIDSTSSTSTTDAGSANAVKTAYDLANAALPGAGGTLTGNVTLNGQSDLRFADSDSSNWVAFQAPATIASDVTWTLPDADATVSGYALVSDGSGTLSWAAAGGGATGGGTDKVFHENDQTVTTNYTLTGKNAVTAGPITINSSAVVTIDTGANWVIV